MHSGTGTYMLSHRSGEPEPSQSDPQVFVLLETIIRYWLRIVCLGTAQTFGINISEEKDQKYTFLTSPQNDS